MGDSHDDEDRDAILRRRHRLIGFALAGLTAGSTLGGCEPCLSPLPPDAGRVDAGVDAGTPQPCLSPPRDAGTDGGPQPCLSIAPDAGIDGGEPDLDAGMPMPCLSPLPPDGGSEKA
jgi:hypothetical protein